MKTTFKERALLSHAIYARIFWIEDFLKGVSDESKNGVLKTLCDDYFEEKAVLEGVLEKLVKVE